MHGDADHPADAVLTKDDYERYHQDRQLFLTALSGDLVSMTFLFLGLSFSDPNLDYILSRVRIWLGKNVRQHYAILRRIQKKDVRGKGAYEYEAQRQYLFINDLKRFGIQTLLIDDYADITRILARLYELHRGRSILISGSAHDYGRWDRDSAEALVRRISGELIRNGYRVVSGFGLGIGSAIISGALEKIYAETDVSVGEKLILRPFPQTARRGERRAQLYTRYRQDLASLAGTAIFLFGNRLKGGQVVEAPGVEEEFNIAVENGLKVIPVGVTGYAARSLWLRVNDDFDRYFPNEKGIKRPFARLGKEDADEDTIISALLEILGRLKG
ncbi:MAG: SIR2 family protein [Rhizobiales bacterium]|nr:SIR2 family protein [Hyphomicrobiales bacterium]